MVAGQVRVDATSEKLLQLDEVDNVNRKSYQEMSNIDRERLEILARLKAHSALLAEYFSRLGQLAESKAASDASASTNSITASLNQIGKQLRGSPLLANASIPGMIAGKALEAKASGLLKRELQEHAQLIREEIATQEAMLSVLSKDVQQDLKVIGEARERRLVIVPLTSEAKIDKASEWAAARQSILTGSSLPQELSQASAAARELRTAFEALAGGGKAESVEALQFRMRALGNQVEMLR